MAEIKRENPETRPKSNVEISNEKHRPEHLEISKKLKGILEEKFNGEEFTKEQARECLNDKLNIGNQVNPFTRENVSNWLNRMISFNLIEKKDSAKDYYCIKR